MVKENLLGDQVSQVQKGESLGPKHRGMMNMKNYKLLTFLEHDR